MPKIQMHLNLASMCPNILNLNLASMYPNILQQRGYIISLSYE